MKRPGLWLAGCLIAPIGLVGSLVIGLIVAIPLLYLEENWRGGHEWAATQAKWEAKGESLDAKSALPASVPDAENIASLPLFQLTPDPDLNNALEPLTLKKAMRSDQGPGIPLITPNWQNGDQLDMQKMRTDVASEFEAAFNQPPGNLDALAQFEQIFPFIADLNKAALTRSHFGLPIDYGISPDKISLGAVSSQIRLIKIFVIHALLALDQQRPEIALADIHTLLTMQRGLAREPMLVAGLVAIAGTAMTIEVINRSLVTHAWSDLQLADIESLLASIDVLGDYRLTMRGELAVFVLPSIKEQARARPPPNSLEKLPPTSWLLSVSYTPEGWFELNMSAVTDGILGSIAWVEPKDHRVYPGSAKGVLAQLDQNAKSWPGWMPWNVLGTGCLGPILNAARQFSRSQVWVDEARIACALERYRLAHSAYPDTLDALAPAFIANVPHDIIDGQPYRYHLQPNGSFLLYSVGWNEMDDGGKAVFKLPPSADEHDSPNNFGDWVWPTPR